MDGSAEEGISGGKEFLIVAGVLADVAMLVGGRTGTVAEEMFGIEPEVVERTKEIHRQESGWETDWREWIRGRSRNNCREPRA